MSTLPMFAAPVDRTETDERFTPLWVFEALGEQFDLDPASPVEFDTNVPARKRYTREHDGLAQEWEGFVWLNPPFSNATPWAERFIAHGSGIWLGPVANSHWFQKMLRAFGSVWLMRDFAFDHPTHSGKRASMPLAMFPAGDRALDAIRRAEQALPAAGVLFVRDPKPRGSQS